MVSNRLIYFDYVHKLYMGWPINDPIHYQYFNKQANPSQLDSLSTRTLHSYIILKSLNTFYILLRDYSNNACPLNTNNFKWSICRDFDLTKREITHKKGTPNPLDWPETCKIEICLPVFYPNLKYTRFIFHRTRIHPARI